MKRGILIFTISLLSSFVSAQNVAINSTGAAAATSSILDVSSTTQGMLIPRMTTAQRDAIASPAEGLLIYNLDCKDVNLYNGTQWIGMSVMTPGITSVVAVGATSATVNWVTSGATTYYLDVSTSATFASFLPGYNNLNVGNVTTYNVTGLTCGTTYYFRIRGGTPCGVSPNSNYMSLIPPCCISNYTCTSIAYSPIAGSGTGVTLGDDQESAALPIGFTFSFYCNNYTSFYISSNGFIEFALGGSGCCGGQCLPNATAPNNLIAISWDDLYPPGAGSIQYFTTGIAPNRRCVINYNGIPLCCGTTVGVNGQIILYETTNVIEIHIATASGITPGTIGVENAAGTVATVAPGYSCATYTINNVAWRFN